MARQWLSGSRAADLASVIDVRDRTLFEVHIIVQTRGSSRISNSKHLVFTVCKISYAMALTFALLISTADLLGEGMESRNVGYGRMLCLTARVFSPS